MKILNLKIKDPSENIIRDIEFNESGISFIYGDIKEPDNKKGTSNSLGKTLLLKFIDYIFGANEDSEIVKADLNGYILEAIIKSNNKKYLIKRILGDSKEIYINKEMKSLTEYKDYFKLKRNIVNKQVIINKKANIISFNTNPNKEDNTNFIKLLNISDIVNNIEEIYLSQDNIKKYKVNKQELVKFYGDLNVKQIDEEIYFIDKEVEKFESQIKDISKKIKNIEISDIQKNVVSEYHSKSKELKEVKSSLEKLKLEKNRLEEFIENSNKVDITSKHIIAIYDKANLEVPELIKRKIEDVENFHKKVYEERKEFLGEKINLINEEVKKNENKTVQLAEQVDKIGKIISLNEVYQESIAIYESFNNELQDLKYKEGQLSQIKEIDDNISDEETKLISNYEIASQKLKDYSEKINQYRDFIYNITQSIYDEDVNSYFDIKIRKKHMTRRPLDIEINLKGDTGEGVSEVKKNIIDYLIFKYNNVLEFLIQDSSCYNGIDPRQVTGMMGILDEISEDIEKQAIIAINKYQLGNDLEIIDKIKDKSSIILSEKDKLLKFDF